MLKAIVVTAGLFVVGGGMTFVIKQPAMSGGRDALPEDVLYTATRGRLTVTITENGTLMAKNSEKITAQTQSGGKITFLIEEGKRVEEGEILCKLDTTELQKQLQQLSLDIIKTKADLDTARTESTSMVTPAE